MNEKIICKNCGATFYNASNKPSRKFCCFECYKRHIKIKHKRITRARMRTVTFFMVSAVIGALWMLLHYVINR